MTDDNEAARAPEIALLSVFAHGERPDAERIARAALAAAAHLPDDRALLYSDLVFLAVGEATRLALEELMSNGPYVYKSEFAKKHRGEGRAEGRAASLLELLDARGIALSPEDRTRVLTCTDEATLSSWLRRAAAAVSDKEIFEP